MRCKYALLDTDFISKTYAIQGNGQEPLINRLMCLPGYSFYCHEQIIVELGRYSGDASIWLQERIERGDITTYSDERILSALQQCHGNLAYGTYLQFLKAACDAFSADYYARRYPGLDPYAFTQQSPQDFLQQLFSRDASIGIGANLGEIKSYILLQLLYLLYGENIYVFCSDDRNARRGALGFYGVRCISVLSLFLRLQRLTNWQRADAEPYIQSLLAMCEEHHQTTFRIIESSPTARTCRVPCRQVMDELWEGRFVELRNGLLRYKDEIL